MKKSLLALAVLGAFAGAASAQSTVTLYGRVDLGIGKQLGADNKFVGNGSGSRLGVRGVEDLGGGLKALFQIEHRFEADNGFAGSGTSGGNNGAAANPNFRMWHGRSIVGIEGGFGRFWMGREYTPVFLASELLSDPWGFDTVAAQGFLTGGIDPVRRDDSINYQVGFGGFTFWGQTGEGNGTPDRPVGFALSYGAGPLYVAWGYDNPGGDEDKWNHFTVNYDFGAFKLWTGFGRGDTAAGLDSRSWVVNATMPIGGGELRAGFGRGEVNDIKTTSYAGIGYHYAMSKRTTLYFDFARNGELDNEKTGYDIGIKHNF
jgi:predicted porin